MQQELLRFDRRAQVVTAVVIVALLGGSFAYLTAVVAPATTTTSTSSSTQSTEITLPGSGQSVSSTRSTATFSTSAVSIVSSTTLACAPGASPSAAVTPPSTLPDYYPLFSTIPSMSMDVQQVIVDQFGRVNSTTAVVGYQVTGKTEMEGTVAIAVNLTVSVNSTTYLSQNATSNSGIGTAYFDADGDLLQWSQINLNATGASAIADATPYLDWYDYELASNLQLANYQNPSSYTAINQTAITVGSTPMNVTYTAPKAIPYSVTECGATTIIDNVLFAYGIVPGTTTPLITYYYSLGTDGAASEAFGYKVVSMTPG